MRFSILFILAFAVFANVGCESIEKRIQKNQSVFDAYPEKIQKIIQEERVEVGFSYQMVEIALGQPDEIYTRTDKSGNSREIWTYKGTYYRRTNTLHNDFYCHICRKHHCGISSHYYHRTHELEEYDRLRLEFEAGNVSAIEQHTRK